jgi:NAD(P)H-dependent FMN reductase
MIMKELRIAVIVGSTREGRVSKKVALWVQQEAAKRIEGTVDVLDIQAFNIPLLGTSDDASGINKWNEELTKYDGFIFVTAEYNHSIPGSLKNALDVARDPWANKAAAIVSYGSVGGARAAEHLKGILTELQIAPVRTQVLLSLFADFANGDFTPQNVHQANLDAMLTQLTKWSTALKTIR